MTGGVALVVLGVWVITQTIFGHALERLGVVAQ